MEVGSRALSESARICQIIPIKQLFSAKRILVPESTENLSAIKLENSTIICSTAGSALQTIPPWSMQPQYRSPLDKAARKTHLRFQMYERAGVCRNGSAYSILDKAFVSRTISHMNGFHKNQILSLFYIVLVAEKICQRIICPAHRRKRDSSP